MGAKIREGTTIGPYSKVGGEVKNTVIFGNSNKGHEGFVGNSVIGEWCNFGADTNTSNMKNNYGHVRLWSYMTKNYEDTGLQFCGLMMGDHSKCGINTMFNTGTVVGVNANIFGSGYPSKHIPSFTWGGVQETEVYEIEKALEAIRRMMERRNIQLALSEEKILRFLYEKRHGEL
jgi:UDP-N-acetylglucosamine diphosphorylase/glucosamine-1-phosphate N-acetyltransferase